MSYDLTKLTHVEVAKLWEQHRDIFTAEQVDLASNKAIDSSGIAFLVQWAKSLPNKVLVIKNASANVRSLIQTFHLEPLFELK